MFLTELHAHTSEVSPCAHQTAAQVADRYIAEGFHTVVVANHYTNYIMNAAGDEWEQRCEHFLSGYRAMKAHAAGRLNVILGMELRFHDTSNDYLIFGFDEKFLREHPDLHLMTLKTFRPLADENGLLVVQAHPFRNGMTVMSPKLLDGYEVFNGHVGHDSRNLLARDWCRRFGKLPTSGSDFHDAHSHTAGGILTEEEICSMEQLTAVLRSGNYTLRCAGPADQLDMDTNFHASEL